MRLLRYHRAPAYTLGILSHDGRYLCHTLEDPDRGLSQDMTEAEIANIKVKGKTAIPTGTYTVTLDVISPKFANKPAYEFCGGKVPRLIGVKGFDGILIHIGNTAQDTAGCILVGDEGDGCVVNSTATFRRLYAELSDLPQPLSLTIL